MTIEWTPEKEMRCLDGQEKWISIAIINVSSGEIIITGLTMDWIRESDGRFFGECRMERITSREDGYQ